MTAPFVEIDRVSLRYGGAGDGTLALAETSIRLARGEFAAIVGPSGCGKSSLLKVLSGLVPASTGGAIVAGGEVAGPVKIAGMAFQNPTMLPWLTTLANVLLPLRIVRPHRERFRRQRAEYEALARALLARVGLAGFEDRFPWQLSGGMLQRASLCRALIHDPQLLLLDEPFGALDTFTREELWGVLQELWMDRRPTVLLVTHDLREAAFLADTIYVMSARPGRVLERCTVPLERPRTLDSMFGPEAVALTHHLRRRIKEAREGGGSAAAAVACAPQEVPA